MKFSLRVSKKNILYLIGFFFLIKPQYFANIGRLSSLYNLCMLFVSIIVLLYSVSRKVLTKNARLILMCELVPLAIAVFEGVTITYSLFLNVLQIVALTLILQNGLDKNFESCMGMFALILEIYAYVNLASIYLFPNGLYTSALTHYTFWFYGYKNVMIRFLLPTICVNAIYTVWKNGRYTPRLIVLIAATIWTQWIVDCKTGVVGILFVVVMMFFFTKRELPKFINLRNVILAIGIVSIALATTSMIEKLSDVLIKLGEETSVYNRTLIWSRAVELISNKPILGYGLRSTEGYRQLFNLSLGWTDFSHPHNYVLYVLIQGGLIVFSIVAILFFGVSKKCIQNRDSFAAKMLLLTYISFFIMGVTESLVGATLLYPLAILTDYILREQVLYIGKHRNNRR